MRDGVEFEPRLGEYDQMFRKLLKKVAVAHARLIESGEKVEQILTIARTAKDGADFSNRLDGLIKK